MPALELGCMIWLIRCGNRWADMFIECGFELKWPPSYCDRYTLSMFSRRLTTDHDCSVWIVSVEMCTKTCCDCSCFCGWVGWLKTTLHKRNNNSSRYQCVFSRSTSRVCIRKSKGKFTFRYLWIRVFTAFNLWSGVGMPGLSFSYWVPYSQARNWQRWLSLLANLVPSRTPHRT